MKIKQKLTSIMLIVGLVASNIVVSNADTKIQDLETYNVNEEQRTSSDWINHWAKAEIQMAIDKGWVAKTNTFRPNDSITRAEFVKIFNKAFKLSKSSGKVFNDTKNHWAKVEIDIAVTNGVCNGKTSTEFKPNDQISREEAAVMISNYKKIADTNLDKLSKYSDFNKVSSWAKPSVEGVIENRYMGVGETVFNPKNKISRAEAVVTLNRVVNGNTFLAYQQEILTLVNKERAKVGVKPLILNKDLTNVATIKSQDMVDNNYFSHNSPIYGSPFDMMKKFGISYRAAGENIAAGQINPQHVMNSWMNSPGHKSNILSTNYSDLGVGIAKASNGKLYWTQMFIGK